MNPPLSNNQPDDSKPGNQEIFPLVTEEGLIIGSATRAQCHAGSFLLHPVVHLHVFRSDGALYLQKRLLTKDIQPGKWDTSVGGHVDWSEVGSISQLAAYQNANNDRKASNQAFNKAQRPVDQSLLNSAVEKALRREACEELGITDFDPVFALAYPFRSDREYELVHTYYTHYDGPIQPVPSEIEEGRFWSLDEIEAAIGTGVFTPNFEQEYPKLMLSRQNERKTPAHSIKTMPVDRG